MKHTEARRAAAPRSAVPACPSCAGMELELQDAREQLAVLRADVEVAERSAKDALREQETTREHCTGLYDFAPNAYVTLDRNGFIRDANVAAERLLREDRTELRGALFMLFVAKKDRRAYLRHLSRCRRSLYPTMVATDLNLICGNGQRTVHMLSTPDQSQRQSRYRTALVDLDESRRAVQSLRDSEARYRLLFELNPCPMYIFDGNTLDFLDVNKAALRLYGYSREAFLAMTVKDILPPDGTPAVMAAIRAQRRTSRGGTARGRRRVRRDLRETGRLGENSPFSAGDWRHTKRDGALFDAAITVSSIQYAGRDAQLVLVNDVTARKAAERQLFEINQRLSALMHALPVGVSFSDDPSCRHVTGNAALLAQFAMSPGDNASASASDPEAAGRKVRYFSKGRRLASTDLPLQRSVAENRVIPAMELEVLLPNGKRWVAEASGAPVRDAKGNTVGGLAVTVDITGRKKAEQALQHRRACEQLLAAASSRLVNVSASELDAVVNKVLADAGRLLLADRCYLFRVTDDLAVADNTHEWCAPGIHSQIANLRSIPTRLFRWMTERLRGGKPLCIPHVADIPAKALAERRLMKRGHVQSVVLVPIRHGGKLTGFIGCDAVRGERHWADSDVRLLQIVGEIISETQVRCRSDEEVRIAAQEWQITFDGVADAVFVLDAQQRITRCNKAAATLFGESVEQIVGRHCFDIVHKTRQPIPECPIARMKRSRQRESMELAMNGRWYQVVVDPLFDRSGELRGAVHAISDITARKQAEEALRNTAAELDRRVEQRTAALKDSAARLETLRSMVNRGPVVLFLWRTVPGRWPVEMVSDNVASVLGYTEEDFMSGRVSWPGITCREDVPRLEAEVARFLEQDVPEWSQEYRVTTKAGKVRWIQDWNRPIKDASGAITHIQGMIVDVTARKHAESVLAQTERALRLLAEFDHALLRRSSERELLRMACRVAVGVGGYRMAWVGYAEHDACKSVRPMELVGLAKGYLSRVTVTWGDDRLGRGPVGTAIRTGKPGLCRDISKDPLFAPWRKEALKRGCASLLALPLMTEQRCIGALAIYSAHANAFSDSEIRLLQQLANDLSFGIMALRGRKERRELEQQVLDISDREQRRIGQDLHDGVGQSLAGIRYLISAVQQTLTGKSAPEAAELERIAQILGKTVQQTHDLARGLFPGELRRGGIADALRELAVYTQEVFGVSCRLTGLTDVRLTDANVASQLYRIAQEAITNAAKHSKTKTVDVHLSQKRGRLALTVHDTGVGLPRTAGNPIGMGQRIMKYRADMIGATLKIKSAPGKGTTVTCVLPSSPPPAQGERGQRAVV